MNIHDDDGRALDLEKLSEAELQVLAYQRPLSRAALVAVVAELKRRTRGRAPAPPRESHDLHDAADGGGDRDDDPVAWW